MGDRKQRQKCPSDIPWGGHKNATPESDSLDGVAILVEEMGRTAIGTEPTVAAAPSPEIALRAAVLRQAIRDSQGNSKDALSANSWFMGNHSSCEGFSFVEICESLSFDPKLTIKKIRGVSKLGNH